MDGMTVYLINRDMLLSGSFCRARLDLMHLFAAAVDRNAIVPDHGRNIAAMLTDIKFLLQLISLPMKSVSK
jgi:hypothetical protein